MILNFSFWRHCATTENHLIALRFQCSQCQSHICTIWHLFVHDDHASLQRFQGYLWNHTTTLLNNCFEEWGAAPQPQVTRSEVSIETRWCCCYLFRLPANKALYFVWKKKKQKMKWKSYFACSFLFSVFVCILKENLAHFPSQRWWQSNKYTIHKKMHHSITVKPNVPAFERLHNQS